MAITTKTNKTYKEFLVFAKTFKVLAIKNIEQDLAAQVIALLEIGTSPTRGGEWRPYYSNMYIEQIKKGKYPGKTISPVNLKLTGSLYQSLKITTRPAQGALRIEFTDAKAKDHDQGLKGLPIRRLFPAGNEKLHSKITSYITRRAKSALLKVARLASDR